MMMNDERCPLHGYLKVSIPVSPSFESDSCMYQDMLTDKEACHSCIVGSVETGESSLVSPSQLRKQERNNEGE